MGAGFGIARANLSLVMTLGMIALGILVDESSGMTTSVYEF